MVQQQESNGINMYPHYFPITISIPQFITNYDHLETNESLSNQIQSIAGRIIRIQAISRKAIFYTIQSDGYQLQIFARLNDFHLGQESLNEFIQQHINIRRSDIIGCSGYPARTRRGDLSLYAQNIILLTPCLRLMPRAEQSINSTEYRYRQRYLDLINRPQTREIFYTRAKIISYIRRFLDSRGFLEVETPILNQIAGGGNAKKFETMHNSLHLPMYLRIAPELYLKQLVIGGLDRVYEIGRQFRNEDMDQTHNPEFTSCEFYCAYWDYNQLMNVTEEMISGLVYQLNNSYKIEYHPTNDAENVVEIDFTPPWNRYDMISTIQNRGEFTIPRPLDGDECNEFLIDRCRDLEILGARPWTTARLLDKLCGYFIEDKITNPAFIINHPVIMSPLAKNHRDDMELTERFECFIMGKELCNAYTELNHPEIQRERFRMQGYDNEMGDDEAMSFDEGYCKALEYGLPPCAGWGLGIDRLTMWLTDSNTIREVMLFPQMKPILNESKEQEDNEADGVAAVEKNGWSWKEIGILVLMIGIVMVFGWVYGDDIAEYLAIGYGWMQQNPIMGTLVNGVGLLVCFGMIRN